MRLYGFPGGLQSALPLLPQCSPGSGAPGTGHGVGGFLRLSEKAPGLLDGVCVTGGEPTLRKELPEFLAEIKALGYLVKLDTNGSNPAMLQKLLEENLLDYVAMDIKNCPERYTQTCGGIPILPAVEECIALLKASTVEWELRTTLCKPFHDKHALEAIGKWLSGTKHYYLQNFVDSGALVGSGVSGFTKEEMEALRDAVLPYIPNTRIRGI